MEIILVNFLNGISFAMILFLIASGLSLIFGVMGVLNLAHGALYVLGALIGITLASYGFNFWLAALVSGVSAAVVGLVMERGFLSRLHKRFNEQVLLTIGFVYIIGNLMLWFWGPFARLSTAPSIVSGSVNIGDVSFPTYRFVIIAFGLAVAAGLWFLTEKTRAGAIVRAGMDDKEMTTGLGVNYRLVCSAVFLLGSFVGGFAGFVASPMIGTQPALGFEFLLYMLIVIVIGGVGKIQGSLLGAVVIGLIDSFGKVYFPDFALFTIYLAMVVVLLVKPSGFLGIGVR